MQSSLIRMSFPKKNTDFDPQIKIYLIRISVSQFPHIRVRIFDTEIDALLDSGAGVSVINSTELAEKHGLKILPAAVRVSTADGTDYSCLGYLNLPFSYKDVTRVIIVITRG